MPVTPDRHVCTQPDCGHVNQPNAEFCALCGQQLPRLEMLGEITPPPNAEIPPLPDDATADQKEEHWYRYVYRGDHVPQLTLRAVLMGGVIGMFMSLSNIYTSVKLGWQFGVAITACVISYVVWNLFRGISGGRLSQMTILENNCMQSTASAAGYSTGGTLGTAFGAWLLISGEHVPLTVLYPFVLFTAALGVFLAIPMKRQMINVEQLKFPSGIAAAETLRSLYSHGREAMAKAYSLIVTLAAGMVIAFMRTREGIVPWIDNVLGRIRIREEFPFPMPFTVPARGHIAGFAFEPSMLLIGAGMIVGMRVCMSMLFGALVLYFVVTPWLVGLDQAMPGAGWVAADGGMAFDPAQKAPETVSNVYTFAPGGETMFGVTRWSLWGGTSIMVFSSLTAVAIQWRTLLRSFNIFKRGEHSASASNRISDVEVPFSWFLVGMIPITIGLVAVNYMAFGISIWMGFIAVAMSFVLALVCCRATGETDTTPTGAMGKVTQLAYALLAPGKDQINLMSAGVTAGAGGASADLLTDLKSGYLLGANARKQFLAQFIGIFFGTLIVVPAFRLMYPTREVLEAYNPPASNMWKAVAEALTKGLDYVPITARYAILIGALVGIALPLISAFLPRLARFLPSAMGLGLAWVVPFQNSLSFAIGAVIAWLWAKRSKKSADLYVVPVASGFVAGESLMAALVAINAAMPAAWPEILKALRLR